MDKGIHPPFPQEGWFWNCQTLLRINSYNHSSQDLQCSTTQLHRMKSIHDITNFDNPSNSRRCSHKKPRSNTIICQLQRSYDMPFSSLSMLHFSSLSLPLFEYNRSLVPLVLLWHIFCPSGIAHGFQASSRFLLFHHYLYRSLLHHK